MTGTIPPKLSEVGAAQRSLRQWQAYAEKALAEGMSREQLRVSMLEQGCPQETVTAILDEAWNKQHKSVNTLLGCSISMVAFGTLATLIGFAAATNSGDTYYIFWGCVLCGIIGVIVGAIRKAKLTR